MSRTLLALYAGCLLAVSAQALQFDLRANRVQPDTPLSALSATLSFAIDGMPIGTRPATQVTGPDGFPAEFHFTFNYDAEFLPLMDCELGPCQAITYSTLTVTVCGNSATRDFPDAPYVPFPALPVLLASTFGPDNQPFPACITCSPSCIVMPPVLSIIPTEFNPNPSETFTIINTSTGPDCPPITGTIAMYCPCLTVSPSGDYSIPTGESLMVTVTYNSEFGPGYYLCEILTSCGTVYVSVDLLKAGQNQPATFALGQAWPNPFNPTTTISYSLAETGPATLALFNVSGQHVRTLVDGLQERGAHQVAFDAAGLPSGLYFYTLAVDGERLTRSCLLMK